MATQLHVSHSALFHGVALFSQAFYRCGPHSLVEFGLRCSKLGMGVFPYDFRLSIGDARRYEWMRLIDPLVNLRGQRIFVWIGELDEYVPLEMAMENAKFYETFTSNKSLIRTTVFHAKHLLPTTNFGDACDQDAGQNVYLGNCNYSGAHAALEFLLRDKANIINPFISTQMQNIPQEEGSLMAYDQSEFYSGRNITDEAMGTLGFIYVPKMCQPQFNIADEPCFLHVNFHGCNEWHPQVALRYIRNSGFLLVADANRILTVFPLTTRVPQNMDGCWDFFSYTGSLFATKKGKQIKIVKAIIDRILGKLK
ncbi:uncharacterized protein LOC110854330 isoform X2 [Folsomia candida]|nr:uncharacterized protein LOC110854330 isoform X2 [Folsomia candida]